MDDMLVHTFAFPTRMPGAALPLGAARQLPKVPNFYLISPYHMGDPEEDGESAGWVWDTDCKIRSGHQVLAATLGPPLKNAILGMSE